ncbi:MAG: phenylacetate--CoA ligase family protein [Gammaproteobacteria bacterium]|nr:phenylacetate--CoA ligase family protein [Gammaproteobacteria bacterium]MCK5091542.1 phenylacetate--CoA ligase family protein [Gammaproteobacteria bacterium]
MESKFKHLYDRLPVTIQNFVLTGYNVLLDRERYGGRYNEYRNFLERSQWFNEEQLVDYQNRQLSSLIKYTYEKVPYYRRIMDARKLKPKDIGSQEDLIKLPVLTKEDIRANFSGLLSTDFNLKSVKRGYTSGTTGTPLEICYDDRVTYMTYAALDRQYQWAETKLGKLGDKIAVLRGNVIVPLYQKHPPFWRYNYYHRQILLSAFHLSPANLPYYVEELRRYQPRILDGYPSTLYILAKYLKNIGEKLILHAVISSSETLYDFQRETIEESFGCKVYDYFSSAERVLFSTECDRHAGHHIVSEYGITEVLNNDQESVSKGETGTLVATSLHNYAMPMIRYVTNDMSALKQQTCACGRCLPLMEDVTTKAEDLITLKDGRLISPSVLTHPFKPITSIVESQVIQESLDIVRIKVVPGPEYSQKDEQTLVDGLQERLGTGIKVLVDQVDQLERSKSGKFRWVISKVDLGI